tara:strand:- start:977 stop:1150 length:174 start_codon:yes stop_codon:yes gene_type:complete
MKTSEEDSINFTALNMPIGQMVRKIKGAKTPEEKEHFEKAKEIAIKRREALFNKSAE